MLLPLRSFGCSRFLISRQILGPYSGQTGCCRHRAYSKTCSYGASIAQARKRLWTAEEILNIKEGEKCSMCTNFATGTKPCEPDGDALLLQKLRSLSAIY